MPLYAQQRCRYGTMLFNTNDEFVGRSLALYGEWSEPEPFLFAQMIREGDTVVEAGANLGSHTVMLSRAVGESGTVFAFEPQRHTFQLLCANLALNERLNVRAYQYAIGDAEGVVEFPLVDRVRRTTSVRRRRFIRRRAPNPCRCARSIRCG
ncbi:FkbM family methyltransferase [Burkholderia multivorans]|uniref:FkbM family methyltransferase n=1 Tax=Burkholderia multivorans TaxID=87883 RepID=UPI0020B312B5|nr:FkbM family methyltransferase [Burkholderia multivorans]